MMGVVKKIELNGTQLCIDFDEEIYSGENRMIIRKNSVYAAEVYDGTIYSTSSQKHNGVITITRNVTATAGDFFSVKLSSGCPGWTSNNLATLATLEVK